MKTEASPGGCRRPLHPRSIFALKPLSAVKASANICLGIALRPKVSHPHHQTTWWKVLTSRRNRPPEVALVKPHISATSSIQTDVVSVNDDDDCSFYSVRTTISNTSTHISAKPKLVKVPEEGCEYTMSTASIPNESPLKPQPRGSPKPPSTLLENTPSTVTDPLPPEMSTLLASPLAEDGIPTTAIILPRDADTKSKVSPTSHP
ncbi:hypothetical protein ONZ45_g6874 [Pleurotus djamor]|nr:hypothetical protein ONZ45_g6874 [Pleurotus djamor]